jgi:hypothetical protein
MAKLKNAGMMVRYGASLNQVLFEEQLDAVSHGLGDAERTGPVRTDAALHVRDDLALKPDHEHDRHHQGGENDQHLDEDDQDDNPVDPVRVQRVVR